MSKTLPVLRKAENEFGPANPDGWKLEDLCAQLIAEVNDRIHNYERIGRDVSRYSAIIEKLAEIMSFQRDANAASRIAVLRDPRASRNVIYPDSVEEEINF